MAIAISGVGNAVPPDETHNETPYGRGLSDDVVRQARTTNPGPFTPIQATSLEQRVGGTIGAASAGFWEFHHRTWQGLQGNAQVDSHAA